MLETFFICLLICITFTTSSLTLYVVISAKMLKTIVGWNMTILASSDLALGLIVLPFSILPSLRLQWIYDTSLCSFQAYVGMLLIVTSLATMSITAVYFYIYICQRLSCSNRVCQMKPFLVAQVLCVCYEAFILSAPFFGWGRFAFLRSASICLVEFSYDRWYFLLLNFGLLPFLALIAFCFINIFYVSKKHNDSLKSIRFLTGQNMLRTQDIRNAKILLLVVICFAVTWTPALVTQLCKVISPDSVPPWLEGVSIWLQFTNTVSNFIVYMSTLGRFRRHVMSLLNFGRLVRCFRRDCDDYEVTLRHM